MSVVRSFELRPDLQSWPLFTKNGTTYYLVGSIEVDRYLVVDEARYPVVTRILDLLREGVPIQEIEARLRENDIQTNVEQFVELLCQAGLTKEDGKEETRAFYSHFRMLSWTLVSLPLTPLGRFLQRWARIFEYTFGISVIASLGMVVFLVLSNVAQAKSMLQAGLSARHSMNVHSLVLSYLSIWLFAIPLHELAHAWLSSRNGVFPRRLTLRLYLLVMPFLSIQLPGLYTLPLRRRLFTLAAGPLMNLLLGNMAWLVAWYADFGGTWKAFFLSFSTINYLLFLFNLSPFLPTDGYQIISQGLFKDIDVRSHAWASFRYWWRTKRRKPSFDQMIVVSIDFVFIALLTTAVVYAIHRSLYRWLAPDMPSLLILWLIDVLLAGFIGYRILNLLGIRNVQPHH